MKIPLEDLFEDIIGKAQRGLKLSDEEVATRAKLTASMLSRLRSGSGTRAEVDAQTRRNEMNGATETPLAPEDAMTTNRGAAISIIMPNHNGARYLAKAIEAFLAQSYDNKELLIVLVKWLASPGFESMNPRIGLG